MANDGLLIAWLSILLSFSFGEVESVRWVPNWMDHEGLGVDAEGVSLAGSNGGNAASVSDKATGIAAGREMVYNAWLVNDRPPWMWRKGRHRREKVTSGSEGGSQDHGVSKETLPGSPGEEAGDLGGSVTVDPHSRAGDSGVDGQVTVPEDPGGGEDSPGNDEIPLDEYDYDLEESLRTFNWTELLPALVVYSLTFLFGVTGNFLIIMATTSCCRRGGGWGSRYAAASGPGRLQTPSPTNVFLASLASADLLLILICIPVKMAKLFSYTWTMGVFLCKFVYYMQTVSTICSVLTLTAISLERYYAIVHPMKAKYTCTVGQATKIVLAIWVASLLLALPILFVQVHLSVGVKIRAYWCFRDLDNVELWRFHEVYLLLLILVLPTCVMAGAYASICWEIWRVMRKRYAMTCGRIGLNPPLDDPLGNGSSEPSQIAESIHVSSKKSMSTRRLNAPRRMNADAAEMESRTATKVIKMLVTVVVLFVICWAPVLIDNVLKAYQVLPVLRDSNSSLRHMGNAFHLMSYFNSCINPIVYGFMSKSFRASFYKVLCKCCHRGIGASSKSKRKPSTNSQSRATSVRYTDTRSIEMFPINPHLYFNSHHAHNHELHEMFD